MKNAVLVFAAFLASTNANACNTESISSVSDDGEIVLFFNGRVWEIDAYDRSNTMLWTVADDVLECSRYLINIDENVSLPRNFISRSVMPCWVVMAASRGAEPSVERSAARGHAKGAKDREVSEIRYYAC